MRFDFRTTILAIQFVVLAGCALQIIPLQDRVGPIYPLQVSAIVVDNYVVAKTDEPANAWVYRSGWKPIPERWTTPTFSDAFSRDIRRQLKPTASDGSSLNLAILEVGLFVEKSAADDVVFVGIATAFSERRYLCKATLNMKHGNTSERIVLERIETKNRALGDLDPDVAQNMVEHCKAALVEDVYKRVKTLMLAT